MKIQVYQEQLTPSGGLPAPRMRAGAPSGVSALGAGLEDLGHGLHYHQEQQGRVWAAQAASEADLAMSQYLMEAQQKAPPGASGFTPAYLKQFDDYAEKALKNAPTETARNALRAHLAQSREYFGRSAIGYEAKEGVRFQGQQIDTGVESSAKLVYANPDLAERELGKWGLTIDSLNIPPAAKAAMLDKAKTDLAWYSVVGQIDQGKNPEKGSTWNLLTVDQQMKAKDYAESKQAKARQELGISLRQDTQDAEAMAAAGVAPTTRARTEGEFMAAYENPEIAQREYARYRAARETAAAVPTLNGKSSTDLMTVVQAKPKATDPNFAVTYENQQIQARAAARILSARAEDPVQYAIGAGDFGFQPLNPGDQQAFASELSRRSAALPAMAEKYGTAGILTKTEAQQLGQHLDALPAEQKVGQLATIAGAVPNDQVYAAVLNSIRPDSPVTALVGHIARVGYAGNALMIAKGEDLLNPSKARGGENGKGGYPMPPEDQLRGAWDEKVGDAYRGYPEAAQTAYQAYRAFYAASAAKRGLASTAIDDDTATAAVQAATGGVTEWKPDWFGNDVKPAFVVLPYGMDESAFTDKITAQWNSIRESVGYPNTDASDIGVYNTGANGEYMVMSGSSWMPGKDGKPIILRAQ